MNPKIGNLQAVIRRLQAAKALTDLQGLSDLSDKIQEACKIAESVEFKLLYEGQWNRPMMKGGE